MGDRDMGDRDMGDRDMGDRDRGEWVEACGVNDIEAEDVASFNLGERKFAIYRSPDEKYFATDGLCSHGQAPLWDGLVMDEVIECPKHNGRFNYKSGKALGAPACVDLKTYKTKVENGRVFIAV